MKSVKAQTVFPSSLLAEIQKYVQGETIYIPKLAANYDSWGANTDSKSIVSLRNKDILKAFKSGVSIPELSAQFFLSEETIKKIVYRKVS
jgi:Mor family transcriptional regulator